MHTRRLGQRAGLESWRVSVPALLALAETLPLRNRSIYRVAACCQSWTVDYRVGTETRHDSSLEQPVDSH